jgi:hypothetical protein
MRLPPLALLALAAYAQPWHAPDATHRILARVPARALAAGRASDSMPASLPLRFDEPADLDSIQVIRYDPATGAALPAPPYPYARHSAERASRFLDLSLPWEFPRGGPTFARGAYLTNAFGSGDHGLLTFDHLQEGDRPSFYAIYYRLRAPGAPLAPYRQGMTGDGSPRRAPHASNLAGSWYSRLTVDDWDGDGLADLIVAAGTGNLLLFRNRGGRHAARFVSAEYLTDASGAILHIAAMMSPEAVDWDGDGQRDLLVGIPGGRLIWYRNTGTNTNRKLAAMGPVKAGGAPIVTPNQPNPEAPFYKTDYAPSVNAVDWDGDGDIDLLLGGYITGRIYFFENTGRGPDGLPLLTARGALEADGKPIDTSWGAHPCAVDLDGDGDLDLLTGAYGKKLGGASAEAPFLYFFENVGDRRHPRLTRREPLYEGAPPREVLAHARPLDWNGDGLIDLVIGVSGKVFRALNTGSKRQPRWKVEEVEAEWGLAPLFATQLVDLNGDGHLDLVQSTLDTEGEPTIQLNLGRGAEGVFGPPRPLLPAGQRIRHPAAYGDGWNFTALHDLDGDGRLDILWADASGNVYFHRDLGGRYDEGGLKLLTTAGPPIHVGPPVVAVGEIRDFTTMQNSRATLATGDLDGDGRADLALGDAYGDVSVFLQRDRLRFAPASKLGSLGSRSVPLIADWDKDGRPDVVASAWNSRIAWYRNLGGGRFGVGQDPGLPKVVVYSPRLLIADWNGDGDEDYLFQSSYPWFCWLDGSYVRGGYAKGEVLRTERREQ